MSVCKINSRNFTHLDIFTLTLIYMYIKLGCTCVGVVGVVGVIGVIGVVDDDVMNVLVEMTFLLHGMSYRSHHATHF